jgi:phage-related protein
MSSVRAYSTPLHKPSSGKYQRLHNHILSQLNNQWSLTYGGAKTANPAIRVAFFADFPGFQLNRSQSPNAEFRRLCEFRVKAVQNQFYKASDSERSKSAKLPPIDAFFARFPDFRYERNRPASEEYQRLRKHLLSQLHTQWSMTYGAAEKTTPAIAAFFARFPGFNNDRSQSPKAEFRRLCEFRLKQVQKQFYKAFGVQFNATFEELENLAKVIKCTLEQLKTRVGTPAHSPPLYSPGNR